MATKSKSLPADVVRTIRDTADRLESFDARALIGVKEDAAWSEIELAYRERLAMFHPNGWTGYDLAGLRTSMESIATRISYAFAHLAEEAAADGELGEDATDDRTTVRGDTNTLDVELSGDRATFPARQL